MVKPKKEKVVSEEPRTVKELAEDLKKEREADSKIESTTITSEATVQEPKEETITLNKSQYDHILETLKKLESVADKGRLYNYETTQAAKSDKKPSIAKLSVYAGGFIVGWRTLKDEIVRHPVTGLPIGESQEYELQILDNESKIQKTTLPSYVSFSNARYNERVDVTILRKSEDFDGSLSYTVRLPDGREYALPAQFIN